MAEPFPVVIHHNPDCGTSRKVPAMIRAAGYEPLVLEDLMAAIPDTARDLLREKGTLAKELGLVAPDASGEMVLREMVAHPVLVNRPIVVTPKRREALWNFRDRADLA